MTAKILVVDDMPPNVKLLEIKLARSFYTVLTAHSGAEALAIAAAEQPDLILLDVMMPHMDGYECCRRLKANPALAHIPVVMITALNETRDLVRGLEAGADDFLTKPPNDTALFARVRSLVRVKMMIDELRLRDDTFRDLEGAEPAPIEAAPARAIVVEADARRAEPVIRALGERLAVRAEPAFSAHQALLRAQDAPVDLFFVSTRLEDGDALRLCAELRSRPETRQAAQIISVDGDDFDTVAVALDLGASDYILRPFNNSELAARVAAQLRRKRYADRLRETVHDGMRLAVTDALTGLYNRRYADRHLARQLAQSRESGAPLSVMALDIDRFKSVNDTYGHAAGDAVLVEFANRLQAEMRGVDLVARYGGEEFVAILQETGCDEAAMAAERVRRAIDRRPFDVGVEALSVTVSAGVAAWRAPSEPAADLLARADAALYAAKSGGRNRVMAAEAAPARQVG